MKKVFVIGLLGYWVIALLGCAIMPQKSEKTGFSSLTSTLEPQAMLKFADVPVPRGFKLLAEDSYTFESTGMRVGVLRYQGKANIDQIVNFYKEQMMIYNWNLLNVIEYGERLLNFDRETESCIVRLLPKGSAVTITISLGPKSQYPKKSQRPIK